MARPLRVEIEGGFYHVFSRGIRKDPIFLNDRDREVFLEKLGDELKKYGIKCHAYVLMKNHYHLLLETPQGGLQRAMHGINGSYANWFKKKHELVGPLFQGRYKAILIEADAYLAVVSAYIHLNPVRKGYLEKPEEYRWSSLKYYIKEKGKPGWLDTGFTLSMFGEGGMARKRYLKYVYEQIGKREDPFREVKLGFVLGSDEYAEMVRDRIKKEKQDLRNVIERGGVEKGLTLNEVIRVVIGEYGVEKEAVFEKKRGNEARKACIYFLKKLTPLTLREIGEIFDMDYAAVSQMVRRFESEVGNDKKLKRRVENIEELLSK